jgi:tRNA-(ms[2]io[6]A)-hydroxylase
MSPARYASSLRKHIRADEPYMLVDVMIIGAFIEARSCERFAAVAPRLDAGLRRFYQSLLRSEARHFTDYLALAHRYSPEPIDGRVAFFAEREAELIRSEDGQFRFHSGLPVANYSLQ